MNAAAVYVACPWESNATHPATAPVHVLIPGRGEPESTYFVRVDELLAWIVAHVHEPYPPGRAE